MKKQVAFLGIILISAFAPLMTQAQNSAEPETLFKKGDPISTENLGLFIAPSFGFTQMDGAGAALFNLRAGVSIKDQISFGGYFSTSMNDIKPQSETVPNVYMDYWTAGGFAEYTLNASKLVHLTFPVYFGYGEVQMDNEIGDTGLGEANFFLVEPSALLEINLLKFLSLNAGAGYRIVGNMSYRNFNQSDLSGITGYVGLKFNLF
ncbi:hypothetical protein [Algoriphagus confluentis]|uniref:Outer membrane protein beta-barrel domain-containing protein n=1 Tax=Algoriphagus confluentis TaxID=1697556 RepID=A0ABQ6PTN3_9BACT|nr:hypothetical protein Aconfl_32530 [Algoriphagus confluentis]